MKGGKGGFKKLADGNHAGIYIRDVHTQLHTHTNIIYIYI